MTDLRQHFEPTPGLPLVRIGIAYPLPPALTELKQTGQLPMMCRLMRRTGGNFSSAQSDALWNRLGSHLSISATHDGIFVQGVCLKRNFTEFSEQVLASLLAPAFQEDELARLKKELEGEWPASLDDDRGLSRRWFRRALYGGHEYGRPSSPSPASIPRITQDSIRQSYEKFSRIAPSFVGIAADYTHEEAGRVLQDLATVTGARKNSLVVPVEHPSPPKSRRLVIVDKGTRSQTQMLVGTLGSCASDEDYTALSIANTVLGGSFGARLMQEIRAKRGLSYGAYSSISATPLRSAFAASTFPNVEQTEECFRLLIDTIKSWHQDGITEEEFAQTQHFLSRSYAFARDTAEKRLNLRMDEAANHLSIGYHDHYQERVQAVTLPEVNQAIRKRIDLNQLTACLVGNADELHNTLHSSFPEFDEWLKVDYREQPGELDIEQLTML